MKDTIRTHYNALELFFFSLRLFYSLILINLPIILT